MSGGPIYRAVRAGLLVTAALAASVIAVAPSAATPTEAPAFSTYLGPPGTEVDVSGAGWDPASGPVDIFADKTQRLDPSEAFYRSVPDAKGVIGGSFLVPDLTPEQYEFWVCQCEAAKPTAAGFRIVFIVEAPIEAPPSLSVDPTSQLPGKTVTLTGSDWSNELGPVSVYANQSDIGAGVAPLTTRTPDDSGSFVAAVIVPSLTVGAHTLFACQQCDGDIDSMPMATAGFELLEPPPLAPSITVAPTSGETGSTATISGTKWSPRRVVWIFATKPASASAAGALLRVHPAANGTFVVSFTVPDVHVGTHQLYACQDCAATGGRAHEAFTAFTIESSSSVPWLWVLAGAAILVLIVAAVGTLINRRSIRRAAARRPRFRVVPDPTFTVEAWPRDRRQPTVRLNPVRDDTFVVESRQTVP